jgi:hypothetical protein
VLVDLFLKVQIAPAIVFAEACRRGDDVLVCELLSNGRVGPLTCDVMSNILPASSMLLTCARTGRTQCASLLSDAGVSVDCHDSDRRTPLHHAAAAGDRDTIQLLLKHCARTEMRDRTDQRAVEIAVRQGDVTCIELLEMAVLEEALHSMCGLTVLRLLYDHVKQINTPALPLGPQAVVIEQMLKDLRPIVLVLEDALRNLCEYSQGLSPTLPPPSDSVIQWALQAYDRWRSFDGDDMSSRCHLAKIGVVALISAGVKVKGDLQERLALISDRLTEIQRAEAATPRWLW